MLSHAKGKNRSSFNLSCNNCMSIKTIKCFNKVQIFMRQHPLFKTHYSNLTSRETNFTKIIPDSQITPTYKLSNQPPTHNPRIPTSVFYKICHKNTWVLRIQRKKQNKTRLTQRVFKLEVGGAFGHGETYTPTSSLCRFQTSKQHYHTKPTTPSTKKTLKTPTL